MCAFINWWVLHHFRGENGGGVGNVNQLLFRALHIESAQRQRQQLSELNSLFTHSTAPTVLWDSFGKSAQDSGLESIT